MPPPPDAELRGRRRVAPGRVYRFRIIYTDESRIDAAALALPTVTGLGYTGVAQLV